MFYNYFYLLFHPFFYQIVHYRKTNLFSYLLDGPFYFYLQANQASLLLEVLFQLMIQIIAYIIKKRS